MISRTGGPILRAVDTKHLSVIERMAEHYAKPENRRAADSSAPAFQLFRPRATPADIVQAVREVWARQRSAPNPPERPDAD